MDDRMRTGKFWGCEGEGDSPEHMNCWGSMCDTLSPSVQGAASLGVLPQGNLQAMSTVIKTSHHQSS